ncbi:MAG: hypothetical protein HYY45_11335 [Deltaproteobacteria bacterium]|nr:hypothetical protein [Deltaproteobacteria bacterium]
MSRCPTCGGLPVAEVNTVPVFAGLVQNEDGGFDYSGNSKVDWNAQEAWRDEDDFTVVHCAELHSWATEVESEAAA